MEDEREFLDHLAGDWVLTGTMGDVSLRQHVNAEWTLGKRFLRMYFTSIVEDDNPTAGYEAVYHIGYNEQNEVFVMHLLDTTEVPLTCDVGHGHRDGNDVAFAFKYGETPFINRFSWDPEAGRWTFLQTYQQDGETHVFATKEMRRASI
jgi:hypothetical protein